MTIETRFDPKSDQVVVNGILKCCYMMEIHPEGRRALHLNIPTGFILNGERIKRKFFSFKRKRSDPPLMKIQVVTTRNDKISLFVKKEDINKASEHMRVNQLINKLPRMFYENKKENDTFVKAFKYCIHSTGKKEPLFLSKINIETVSEYAREFLGFYKKNLSSWSHESFYFTSSTSTVVTTTPCHMRFTSCRIHIHSYKKPNFTLSM